VTGLTVNVNEQRGEIGKRLDDAYGYCLALFLHADLGIHITHDKTINVTIKYNIIPSCNRP
jgi:hypothetical protein